MSSIKVRVHRFFSREMISRSVTTLFLVFSVNQILTAQVIVCIVLLVPPSEGELALDLFDFPYFECRGAFFILMQEQHIR